MRHLILVATLALAGCAATSYDIAVMPRDSGKLYTGTAGNVGGREGPISIAIEGRTYTGSWVESVPSYSTGYVSGGFGWGGRYGGWGGVGGGYVNMDNPQGGLAKALLQAPDGSGLRCDLHGTPGGGSGMCRDDRGREYDVQLRPAATK